MNQTLIQKHLDKERSLPKSYQWSRVFYRATRYMMQDRMSAKAANERARIEIQKEDEQANAQTRLTF